MRVLISGAGIAGPTLAYWLLRGGHEVTLIEKAPALRRGGYLVDFWGAGFDVADQMGIVPELRRRGYVMTEARSVDRQGRRIASIKPAKIMGPTERYVSIARSDLADVIYQSLDGAAELIVGDSDPTEMLNARSMNRSLCMKKGRKSGSTVPGLARSTMACAEQMPSKSATATLR